MARRMWTYGADTGWAPLNFVSSVGAAILAASVVIFAWNVIASLMRGRIAGDDPWDAWTLEWATSSPPPQENFTAIPRATSKRPLWDRKHPEQKDPS
jgi:heme/copper-type cytochrome/quinol oxidase subunit 1